MEEARGKTMAVEVGAFDRKMGEEVGAFGRRMGEEAGAFGKMMGEEVGAFERTVGGVVGMSERTGEEGEACERRQGEEKEALVRSLGVEGVAMGRKMSEGAVAEEGMMTAEVGEGEGRRRWVEVGEEAPVHHRRCRWPRRSRQSPFSLGVFGNPGSDRHFPVAAALHGVCPPLGRHSSCYR